MAGRTICPFWSSAKLRDKFDGKEETNWCAAGTELNCMRERELAARFLPSKMPRRSHSRARASLEQN